MPISLFDLFTIGIGPSSSHTVGPMRAARRFVDGLIEDAQLEATAAVKAEMYGSLGATGRGHGSDRAVLLGLEGETPEEVDPSVITPRVAEIRASGSLALAGRRRVPFVEKEHLVFLRGRSLPGHPNGMRFTALDASGATVRERIYYSVGGGFVVADPMPDPGSVARVRRPVPYPFFTGDELLSRCRESGLSISRMVLLNECALVGGPHAAAEASVRERVSRVWRAMRECVTRGCASEGVLPGPFKVRRRAAELSRRLTSQFATNPADPLLALDWVNLWALAVNEENAAGGRVVTAPTNGAAGIVPAVLHYAERFVPGFDEDRACRFLLTASAIAALYKENASISGADVGCQGEVGVACSMAAGALAELLGGTTEQVENAAEIGMEHNLGLTCDPIGGLVQIPCIERNAMGAVKAINAARLALRGDGQHYVSLDAVIKTMRDTGRDMSTKYKETARGGLAVNVIEC